MSEAGPGHGAPVKVGDVLYWATFQGNRDPKTIESYNLDTGAEAAVYTFTGGTDGSHPTSSLVFDAAGNLYGATSGEYFRGEFGTVFKLAPNS